MESSTWSFKKPTIWILIGAIIVFLLVALGSIQWLYGLGERQHSQAVLMTQMAQVNWTPLATPTSMSPTATPTPMTPGNIYIVSEIENAYFHDHGFNYLKIKLSNKNVPTLVIEAHCAAPSWPSPEVGHEYTLNSYGVLVPIEGIYSPLQRFFVMP